MNELIPLSQTEINGEPVETVNARELHALLEVKRHFSSWIKGRIEDGQFVEGVHYVVFPQTGENPKGGRPSKEYYITLQMAAHLSMMERNKRGYQARDYFFECAERLKQMHEQPPALDDPAALRGLLLNYTERVLKLEAKIEEDKPKVSFYDQFLNADGLYGLQNAARAIGARPNLFIRWLKQKYLFTQGGALVARIRFIQMGIFEVKSTIIDDKARPRTFITPKGLEYLRERVPENILTVNRAAEGQPSLAL